MGFSIIRKFVARFLMALVITLLGGLVGLAILLHMLLANHPSIGAMAVQETLYVTLPVLAALRYL